MRGERENIREITNNEGTFGSAEQYAAMAGVPKKEVEPNPHRAEAMARAEDPYVVMIQNAEAAGLHGLALRIAKESNKAGEKAGKRYSKEHKKEDKAFEKADEQAADALRKTHEALATGALDKGRIEIFSGPPTQTTWEATNRIFSALGISQSERLRQSDKARDKFERENPDRVLITKGIKRYFIVGSEYYMSHHESTSLGITLHETKPDVYGEGEKKQKMFKLSISRTKT